MSELMPEYSAWRTSSRSGGTACVEARFGQEVVQVRDSKDRRGPMLTFRRDEWLAFLEGVRLDEFEFPNAG
jgi:hypothetical protein